MTQPSTVLPIVQLVGQEVIILGDLLHLRLFVLIDADAEHVIFRLCLVDGLQRLASMPSTVIDDLLIRGIFP